MLDRRAPDTHCIRHAVQPSLYVLEHLSMFPPGAAALLGVHFSFNARLLHFEYCNVIKKIKSRKQARKDMFLHGLGQERIASDICFLSASVCEAGSAIRPSHPAHAQEGPALTSCQ